MRKSIGLNVKEPKEKCEDENCPWHGSLSVRGKVFQGVVTSSKMHNTAVVEFAYHRLIRKYERYERRKVSLSAHNPPCIKAREGDQVVIAECRPLSKTKGFVIVGFPKAR